MTKQFGEKLTAGWNRQGFTPAAQAKKFRAAEEYLAAAYSHLSIPLDQSAYTQEFDDYYAGFASVTGVILTKNEFWRMCMAKRKAGEMPRTSGRKIKAKKVRRAAKGLAAAVGSAPEVSVDV